MHESLALVKLLIENSGKIKTARQNTMSNIKLKSLKPPKSKEMVPVVQQGKNTSGPLS